MDTSTHANLAYSIVLRGVHDALTKLPQDQAKALHLSISDQASLLLSEHKPSQEDRATLERLVAEMLSSLQRAVYVLPR